MDFRMNPQLMDQIHRSRHVEERALTPAAHRFAGRLRGETPVESGATAASTRVEGGHRSIDGRSRAVRVVQGGRPGTAAPQTEFGNSRTRAANQFGRAGAR
ncbi:hypothetical protein GCM10009613_61210 [Pseudonocardia kongjuensis]|uniref:Uncharacterized protein n=1 Tax=Pseudonocardia kongjuensis TaxID=102227 RepID=A0ABP4IYB9_9PSEU